VGTPAVTSTATLLDQIRDALVAEAEQAPTRAEQYSHSKRQGLRNSVPIYVQRGKTAMGAVALIDQIEYHPQPRYGHPQAPPRRAVSAYGTSNSERPLGLEIGTPAEQS
jgi:hypothetical protein